MLKRFLCIFFALMICLSAFSLAANAQSNEDISTETLLLYKSSSDGMYYVLPDQAVSALSNVETEPLMAVSVEGTDVYHNDSAGYLMRIDNYRLMEADLLAIDPYDLNGFEQIAVEYNLSDLVQKDVKNCITNFIDGYATPLDDIKVRVPREYSSDGARSETVSRRTYTGYAGKTYYEELVILKANSTSFNVRMPSKYTVKDYLWDVFQAGIVNSAGMFVDSMSGNMWTIMSTVFPKGFDEDSLPTNAAMTHTAVLIENKSRKYTWVYEADDIFIGSILDNASDYRFVNYVNIPGVSVNESGQTDWQHNKVTGYDKADEIAYRNYKYEGYTDIIRTYAYKNTEANITTTVRSLMDGD